MSARVTGSSRWVLVDDAAPRDVPSSKNSYVIDPLVEVVVHVNVVDPPSVTAE